MRISETCIQRPVFASVLSLIIVLIGLISYSRLTVREYPKIDEPIVSVDTTYKGASPEVIESQVTKPLEDQLAGIEGVDVMTSRSRSERSLINIKFNLKRDPDAAAAEVRDKVSRARRFLPDEIDEPIIGKVEADSQPIIYIAVESGSLSAIQTSDYINRYIKTRLSVRCPARPRCACSASGSPSMRIYVDRDKLAAYGLTVQDVEGLAAQPERRDPGWPHRVAGARVLGGVVHRPADDQAVRECDRRQRQGLSAAATWPGSRSERP